MGTTTILNEQGDTTIAWLAERDAEMAAIITKKMKEGVTFFIILDDGAQAELKTRTAAGLLKKVGETRRLVVRDADFAAFVEAGKGAEIATPKAPMRNTRVSRDPKEIASSHSVGVRQQRGG